MNILVIDTATEACSVALSFEDNLFCEYEVCPQQHSQKLLPMVDSVLAQAGIELSRLDGLGFGRGPGSFTGVRIGTGMIQGLALGADLPVVGVSTLGAMAQQVWQSEGSREVAVAIDARMDEVYFASFEEKSGIMEVRLPEQVAPPLHVCEQLGDTLNGISKAGTGWQAYEQFGAQAEPSVLYPRAEFMLPLARAAFAQGLGTCVEDIQPVYLRDKVTWKKLPGRE